MRSEGKVKQVSQAVKFLAKKARTSILAFFALYTILHPQFVVGKLHVLLCKLVQDVIDGKLGPRQAIAVPPQHGKTFILTKITTAWVMGAKPGLQVAITSFDQAHATEIAVDIKENFLHSLAFRLTFPEVGISPVLDQQNRFSMTNGSTLRAKGAGSKLIGRRVDWLIVDDPHKGRAEAESPADREKVRRWYFGDLLSRLSPNAKVFIIATRWHPEDLTGQLTSEEYIEQVTRDGHPEHVYRLTKLRAISEGEDDDPLKRPAGEPLAPELGRDKKFLQSIRAEQTLYEWSSQYQQDPQTSGSGQVDTKMIRYCGREDIPEGLEYVRGWDLAISMSTAADFSVGPLVAYDSGTKSLYVVDMKRLKLGWPKLKQSIIGQALSDKETYGLARIGVEGVSGFEACYHEVRAALQGEVRVEKRNPPNNDGKFIRALRWFNLIEAENFYLVRGDWNRDFVAELAQFPDGDHDDQVDGISICFEMHTKRQRLLIG